MRIQQLDLLRYGHFTNTAIGFPAGTPDMQIVLGVRLWGKGTRSGVEIDQRFAFLYSVDEQGKISRAKLFPDVQAALARAESSAAQHA